MKPLRAVMLATALIVMFVVLSSGRAAGQGAAPGFADMTGRVFVPLCLNCHASTLTGGGRNGAPSSVNFDTYTLAAVNAARGNSRVQESTMPPASSGETADDTQKAMFQDWTDAGAPLGEVVDYQDMREEVFVPACLPCHDSGRSGGDRNGAPSGIDYDTFEAAEANASNGNLRAQNGTMPPSISGLSLDDTQKALFQDWLWLDTPSGRTVTFAQLSDSLFEGSCIRCHDSGRSGSERNGAPAAVNYDNYDDAAGNALITNNLLHTASGAPHGPQPEGIREMSFDWIYAGLPGEETAAGGPFCDLDGNGAAEIADIIQLLVRILENGYDAGYDLNGDGSLNIADAVKLIVYIRGGLCAEQGALLAAAGSPLRPKWLESLDSATAARVEDMLGLLGLTPEEQASFRLALRGHAGQPALPKAFSLAGNSPNPFNPSTSIYYTVPEGTLTRVRIEVFNVAGRLVRVLVDSEKLPGSHTVFWDGTDSRGNGAASGVYFYRMTAGGFSSMRKMVLLK